MMATGESMTEPEPYRSMVVNEVPLWDAKVKAIMIELREWINDRETQPIMVREAIAALTKELELLTYKLETGRWAEGILADPQLELEPAPDRDTDILPVKSVLDLTPEEFHARWDELTRTDKLRWIMEDKS